MGYQATVIPEAVCASAVYSIVQVPSTVRLQGLTYWELFDCWALSETSLINVLFLWLVSKCQMVCFRGTVAMENKRSTSRQEMRHPRHNWTVWVDRAVSRLSRAPIIESDCHGTVLHYTRLPCAFHPLSFCPFFFP